MPYTRTYLEDDLDADLESDDFDEVFFESDDDFEGWDDEALGVRWPIYKKTKKSSSYRRPSSIKPVAGASGAVVQTAAGAARMRFGKELATKESVDAAIKALKNEITIASAAIKKVDQTIEKNTSIVDQKVNKVNASVKKGMQQMQQTMMLPMLMMKPNLSAISLLESTAAAGTPATSYNVTSQTFKDDMNMMLLLFMMMPGGFGGDEKEGSNMNMMMMALILSNAFK